MKVLFVSNDSRIFDGDSDVRDRMRAYAATIGELHVLSPALLGTNPTAEGGLVLHPFIGGKLMAQFVLPKTVRQLINKYQIEVVSAQDPFEYGRIAMKAVEGTSATLHIQIHTDFLSPWFTKGGGFRSMEVRMPALNKTRRAIAKTVLPKARGVRVVSERIKNSLLETYGTTVVAPSVIPVAVPSVLPPKVSLPDHPFTFPLITISRLEPEKRVQDILMAIGRIKKEYPSIGLFVVGDGRERKSLELLTKRLGLSERVIFTGWRNDAIGLLQSASAYIQASAYEGYGRTLVEAALARVPIITTDVGIVGEVFRGYEEVLSAPVADPAALALHMRGIVDDRQARLTYIMNAERAAAEHLLMNENAPERIAADLMNTLSSHR